MFGRSEGAILSLKPGPLATGGAVSLSRYQDRQCGSDNVTTILNTTMNWKYLLGSLTVLWAGCAGGEEEEEERMCEEGEDWCKDPLDYPHNIIKNIDSFDPLLLHFTENNRPEGTEDKPQKLHPKHPDSFIQQACPTQEEFITPMAGRNKNKQWRYILNSDKAMPEYQQVLMMMMMMMMMMMK